MEKGKQYEVEIIDLGTDGDGIGRIEGMAVFIPGAFPGDVLLVEITSIKKSFARGRVVERRKAASLREQPSCLYAGRCGGCQLQGMRYEGQLKLKEKWVRDRLAHIGGVEDPLVRPILGMEEPIRYRNKAFFPVGRLQGSEKKERGCSVGFYQAKSMQVVNCDTCMLQEETAERVAEVIRCYVKQTKIPIFDKETGTGVLRGVMVRTAFGTGQVMVILVATERRLPMVEWLVEELEQALSELSQEIGKRLETQWAQTGRPEDAGQGEDYGFFLESVILNVNKKKGQGGLGADCITLAGQPVITDYACGLELEISPLSFYQVNPIQMEVLYKKAAEYAGLTGTETVFDLYCGVGTMGLTMAGKAGRLLGIESVRSAVLNANRNAVLNGIVNARFVCGQAEEALPRILAEGMEWDGGERIDLKPDVILLDPPRNGCEETLLKAAAAARPKRIVYVSCDPATLARDVKVLSQLGYAFVEAQPVDLFPWTLHVETVVLLSKLNTKQHIEVELNLDELDLTAAESKATYEEIREYVLEHTGLKVSHLYIAQVKQKYGIIERENYNKPKSENSRQPKCPPEKEAAITEALKHFGMI